MAAAEQACGLGPAGTRRLLRATLETLSETLLPAEAAQLSRRLPAEIAPYVEAGPAAQRMETLSREEFLWRVMVRTGADQDRCEQVADAIQQVVAVTAARTGMRLPAGPFSHPQPAAGPPSDTAASADTTAA